MRLNPVSTCLMSYLDGQHTEMTEHNGGESVSDNELEDTRENQK